MSIVISMKSSNAIILAADSRVHCPKTGFYLDKEKKIYSFDNRLAVAWVGYENFALKIKEVISEHLYTHPSATFAELVSNFQGTAIKNWKDFLNLTGGTKQKVSFILAGFNKNHEPEVYLSSVEDSFVLIHKIDFCVALGSDQIVVPYISHLAPFIKSTEDMKKVAVYLLYETSQFYLNVSSNYFNVMVIEPEKITPFTFQEIEAIKRHVLTKNKIMWKNFFLPQSSTD